MTKVELMLAAERRLGAVVALAAGLAGVPQVAAATQQAAEPPKEQILEVKELTRPRARAEANPVLILQDLEVEVTGTVDLHERSARYDYSFTNLRDTLRRLLVVSPLQDEDRRSLALAGHEKKTERFTGHVRVATLSPRTHHVEVRPYVVASAEEAKDKLLVARFAADIRLRLPVGARLLKSTVPLAQAGVTEYRLTTRMAPLLPPIGVWYTTADEKISTEKTVAGTTQITVTLTVKNESAGEIGELTLMTRFPATVFSPLPELSDGDFVLEQEVMYTWRARVPRIAPGGVATLRYSIRNEMGNRETAGQEITILNQAGDLIGVVQ